MPYDFYCFCSCVMVLTPSLSSTVKEMRSPSLIALNTNGSCSLYSCAADMVVLEPVVPVWDSATAIVPFAGSIWLIVPEWDSWASALSESSAVAATPRMVARDVLMTGLQFWDRLQQAA